MAAQVAELIVWRGSDAHAFVVRNGISTRELADEIKLSPRRVRELFRMQRLSERDRQRIVAGVERLTRRVAAPDDVALHTITPDELDGDVAELASVLTESSPIAPHERAALDSVSLTEGGQGIAN
jgi:hypothetical protein